MIFRKEENGIVLLVIENDRIRAELAPALGGKFTSVYNKILGREFLWHNTALQLEKSAPGADYEDNFWGGIDELIPNDVPENVDGIDYPDHGELWTTELEATLENGKVGLWGVLPKSGLYYLKEVSVVDGKPEIRVRYVIRNTADASRSFLWKLHAALRISPGDRVVSNAKAARIVYPQSSRFSFQGEFPWPQIEGQNASIVPPKDGSMDFFYLYRETTGAMSMFSEGDRLQFRYEYDPAVFPYQWYFASFGQFRDHYTAILEPATAMPFSVNEAAAQGQCTVLKPGEEIVTTVTIYAGKSQI
ncbi:hypothetical protein GCM10023091_31480 [Ravibacter arvi]|uniref:DUF5107 domain-containing protein n=1 Tax=Ravibacter arvi TaxID=2051041 RepID=A0ABP8M3M4_9BACT